MKPNGKAHSQRLEKLIRLVNQEQEAGRLTEQQVKTIAKKSLKPLEENESSMAYFMIGGGLDEEVAKQCCTILTEQLKQHLPASSHALKVIEKMKPPKQTGRQ